MVAAVPRHGRRRHPVSRIGRHRRHHLLLLLLFATNQLFGVPVRVCTQACTEQVYRPSDRTAETYAGRAHNQITIKNKLSLRGRRDDMPPADGSSTRGGSTPCERDRDPTVLLGWTPDPSPRLKVTGIGRAYKSIFIQVRIVKCNVRNTYIVTTSQKQRR